MAVINLARLSIDPTSSRPSKKKAACPSDTARKITTFVKEQKLKKVQVSIQGDQLRVTSGSKDELQNAIRVLRAQDFGVELQFGNFRD